VVARDWQYRHGDFRRALAANEELLAAAERYGSVPGQAEALVQLTGIRAILGDMAGAAAARERAREMVARLGPAHRLRFVLEVGEESVLAYYMGGDWPALAERAAAFAGASDAARSPLGLTAAAFAAFARARIGDAAEARRLLALVTPVAERLDPSTYMWNGVANIGATTVWELGARELAGPYTRLARTALAAGLGPGPFGSTELTLARMVALVDGPAAAADAFARGRAALEADGRLPLRAIADHDEALAIVLAGASDWEPAAALVEAARARFGTLGMTDWAARAGALGERVRRGSAGPDGLTAREVDAVRLLAAGLSNKEIAERLVISVRTAEHHLANAYGKIGVRGRAEAVAYALRHDLT
jgi:DNA-binding CsgD family transcriptional regulator